MNKELIEKILTRSKINLNNTEQLEKYTEQVIKECLDICMDRHWEFVGTSPGKCDDKMLNEFNRGYHSGRKMEASFLAKHLKRYFGVE